MSQDDEGRRDDGQGRAEGDDGACAQGGAGLYARTLEDGTEVIYRIRPSDDGFAAGWEGKIGGDSSDGHEQFSSHADALKYLEENFDALLGRE